MRMATALTLAKTPGPAKGADKFRRICGDHLLSFSHSKEDAVTKIRRKRESEVGRVSRAWCVGITLHASIEGNGRSSNVR